MAYKEYVKQLIEERRKAKAALEGIDSKKEFLDASYAIKNIEKKMDYIYTNLFNTVDDETFIKINSKIYGEAFSNNVEKHIANANYDHIFTKYRDNPRIFEPYGLENIGDNKQKDYIEALKEMKVKFIDKGMTEEEIANNPEALNWLNGLKDTFKLNFLSREERTNFGNKLLHGNNVKKEQLDAQKVLDGQTLKNLFKASKAVADDPRTNELDRHALALYLYTDEAELGVKLYKDNYHEKFIEAADDVVEKDKLEEVYAGVSNIKNYEDYTEADALIKNRLSPKINDYINKLESGELNPPEGKSKEAIINSLKKADNLLTDPNDEYYSYANSVKTNVESHNEHKDAMDIIEALKTYEGGKFYQVYDQDVKSEQSLLNNQLNTETANVSKGKEALAEEFKTIKPKFSEEYINDIRIVMNKLKAMNPAQPGQVVAEEGFKIYAFRKLMTSKAALMEAIESGDLTNIEALTNQYEQDHKDMEEIFEIMKKYDPETVPANVGSERNKEIPYEFSMHYKTTSLVNSLYILNQYLEANHITFDEFLADTSNVVTRDLLTAMNERSLDNIYKSTIRANPGPYGRALALAKLTYKDNSMEFTQNTHHIAKASNERGLSGIIAGEPNYENRQQSRLFMHMQATTSSEGAVFREGMRIASFFEENEIDTLSNILLHRVEDLDVNKCKAGDYLSSDGIKRNNPPIDKGKYILEKNITAREMLENIKALAYLGNAKDAMNDEFKQFNSDLCGPTAVLATMQNVNEYLMLYPEQKATPEYKELEKFMSNPSRYIERLADKLDSTALEYDENDKEAFRQFNTKLKNERKTAMEVYNDFKKIVEVPFVKAEKEFNVVAANIINDIKKISEKIGKGINVEENTKLLLQAQNKYKLFAGDKTIELIDRYKRGLIPESYLKNRIKNINEMNIKPKDSVDLFKDASQKEKAGFHHAYKEFNMKGKIIANEVPKDLNVISTNMAKISGDMDIVSDFTDAEMNLINKSLNKDIYRNVDNLTTDLNEILGVKEEPKVEINYDDSLIDDSRVQIHVDLNESKESKKSQFIDNDDKAVEKDNILNEDVKDSFVK